MGSSLETTFVQLGNRSDGVTGAVNPPVYLSTAYAHDGIGQSTGYDYSRTKNPTRSVLEDGFAALEKGDRAFACSSGMAAIQLVLSLFRCGDTLLVPEDIYGGTYRLFNFYSESFGVTPIYAPFRTVEETAAKITDETKAIFLETPTNPLMQEIDIEAYAKLAKAYNLLLIVDNTFLTPYFQQPITQGADIVIHSATKYIGGHNDVLAGLVVSKGAELSERLSVLHNGTGAVLSPLDAWLLIRGLKTLPLRMRQHQINAERITAYLREEPKVKDVLYAGKGGMLSFRVKDSKWVDPFLRSLNIITFAESLGGVESFITYPTTQTHADIPVEEREARGICDRLLRFSVGIEEADDLIGDLQQAFERLD